MQDRPSESTAALIAMVLRDGGTLLGRTLALARIEIDGNVRALVGLFAILGTIVVLLISAFFVFLDALVKAVAVLIGSEAVAACLVASPFVIVTIVLATIGVRRIVRGTPMAKRGADRLKADLRSIRPSR
ncbi:phage holin family protein [uncultured Methylobacterium sp.]|uniref:phage holin family protein n=1 Tax=uncultured Methylobacterium sp. TaxID=157278 RepID=UPI0035C9FD8E